MKIIHFKSLGTTLLRIAGHYLTSLYGSVPPVDCGYPISCWPLCHHPLTGLYASTVFCDVLVYSIISVVPPSLSSHPSSSIIFGGGVQKSPSFGKFWSHSEIASPDVQVIIWVLYMYQVCGVSHYRIYGFLCVPEQGLQGASRCFRIYKESTCSTLDFRGPF